MNYRKNVNLKTIKTELKTLKEKDKKTEWKYFPFILLSKIYIKFYNGKKDLWVIFPSLILSLIISLNVYVLIKLNYNIGIYWIAGIYFILYFFFFILFQRKFPKYEFVKKTKMNKTESGITVVVLISTILNFIFLLNIIRNNNV